MEAPDRLSPWWKHFVILTVVAGFTILIWLAAKETASFCGMRDNLVAMLDHFGVHSWLGLDSFQRLFEESTGCVHKTLLLGGVNSFV